MTARPHDPESRRMPAYAAVALVLAMVAVLLAAGCSNGYNSQEPDKEIVAIPLTSSIPTKNPMTSLDLYRQNLTFPRNKIPENVLQITDPDFPDLGIPQERIRSNAIASHHLIAAEDAKKRFNITSDNGQPVGDQVFLTIYVHSNTSTHVLDPFVTEVTNRKEQFHGIDAWIDVNNVERLAALDQIRGIQLAEFMEHG
ncbi:MAG: hypothetical protein WC379_16530 [Methanoregula sp.]|jgi:hypothetical protein